MEPERWQQLDDPFHAALHREHTERAALLNHSVQMTIGYATKARRCLLRMKWRVVLSKPELDPEARPIANDQSESLRDRQSDTIGLFLRHQVGEEIKKLKG